MTARHASDGAALPQRIADQFERHATDLRFPRLADAALAAAYRVLADAEIADGLRARAVVAAIDTMHQPRTWGHGEITGAVVVCARCQTEWPCETKRLTSGGTETPARLDPDPVGPSGLPDPRTGDAQGEAVAGPGHQPDWDGNRCANCNARLTDGGPCPMTDEMPAVAS